MASSQQGAKLRLALNSSFLSICSRWPLWAALIGVAGLARCSSSDSGGFGGEFAATGGAGQSQRIGSELTLGNSGTGATTGDGDFNALCGQGDCLPDHEAACLSMGGAGGAVFGSAGSAGAGSEPDFQALSCQVKSSQCEDGSCEVERACAPAGPSTEGEPCVAASDCGPGLACVGEDSSGTCRPYCCAGSGASCAFDTFCDERQLVESPELYVPVCLPVDNCPLTEPFPCAEGQDCACSGARACIVVGTSGSTACAVPGAGQAGDPCTGTETGECAHGFVCSPSAGCMKLCSTVAQDSGCPDAGTCQSPSEFPEDMGVCVGADSGTSAAK